MKRCNRCKNEKQLDEFHKNKRSNDGLQYCCKECTKIFNDNYLNTEKGKVARAKYKHKYNRTEKGKAVIAINNAKYRKTEKGRISGRAYRSSKLGKECIARAQEKYPFRMKARWAVKYAIKEGQIIRPDICSKCGYKSEHEKGYIGKIQAHHDSYKKDDWLNVRFLCLSCHKSWHKNNTPTPYN